MVNWRHVYQLLDLKSLISKVGDEFAGYAT